MKSIGQMLETIEGLCGTKDVNDWENKFIKSCVETVGHPMVTTRLSSKQVEIVKRIFDKHFA